MSRKGLKYGLIVLFLGTYLYGGYSLFLKKKEKLVVLDEAVPEVKLVVRDVQQQAMLEFGDKSRIVLESVGVAVLTWDDFQKQKERFGEKADQLKPEDFPAVVLFNLSGFDTTGDPMEVRRVSDGKVVMFLSNKPKAVRTMLPTRDGKFRLFFWDNTEEVISSDEWYIRYVGVSPPKSIPSFEELEKMSDAELKALGLTRMNRDEYEKLYGQKLEAKNTGVRGKVILVGGTPAVIPLKVKVFAFPDKVDPRTVTEKDAIVSTMSSDDGSYVLNLPAGKYKIAVQYNGHFRGNAVIQTTWPVVEVGNTWVDYEFRVMK